MYNKVLTLASILTMRFAPGGSKVAEFFIDKKIAPGANKLKFLTDNITTDVIVQPPGMPTYPNKGDEYPDNNSQNPNNRPEQMPDYTPSTSPNNPPDKNPPDKPYTPPPGMPNYDPSDPNQPKEPILPIDPSKSPFPSPYPWDKDFPPDPSVDPLVLDLDGDGIILVGRAVA